MNTPTPDHSSSFQVLELAYELIRSLRPIVAKMQQHDSTEAKQTRDAANSVAHNISEGNRRTGKDRRHFFNIAAGSADEVRGGVRGGVAWGYLEPGEVADSLAIVDRIVAMLYRLTH